MTEETTVKQNPDDERGADAAQKHETHETHETQPLPTEVMDSATGPTEVLDSATGPTEATEATAPPEGIGPSDGSAAWPFGQQATPQPPRPTLAGYGEPARIRPRVRAGAIVWGVLVMAFAAAAVTVCGAADVRSAFQAWQASITPAGRAVLGVIALGVVVLLVAGVSAIRGAQRRAAGSARS